MAIATENEAWTAAQAAPTEAEQVIHTAVTEQSKNGILARVNLNVWEVAVARHMTKKGKLVMYTDRDGAVKCFGLPVVLNGVPVPHAGFHAKGFTDHVAKFVKRIQNDEDEDHLFHWIRVNKGKFLEYAEALKAVAGVEHEKLDWHGMDRD